MATSVVLFLRSHMAAPPTQKFRFVFSPVRSFYIAILYNWRDKYAYSATTVCVCVSVANRSLVVVAGWLCGHTSARFTIEIIMNIAFSGADAAS